MSAALQACAATNHHALGQAANAGLARGSELPMPNFAESTCASDVVSERYRLVSVDATPAPAGDASDDWLVYRIERAQSTVTGYRRGTRDSVTAAVERIVDSLNERMLVKMRPYRSAGRPRNAAPRVEV